MSTRRKGPAPWVSTLVGALLLSACATVPTSGPIEQGPVVDSGESTQFIRVIAAPPSPGATADGIVRGFLEAGPSFEHDHGIARRYLTLQAGQAWRPGPEVTVYDPDSLRLTTRGTRVSVEFATTGRLGADGSLVAVDPPAPDSVTFRMERVSESGTEGWQWRIGEPPDRLLISSTDLRRAYRAYDVLFASDRGPALVPDARLLPVVGPSLPARLAQLVLAGPAPWLAGAVHSGMPEGGGLASDTVPVVEGVARVSLTEQARSATGAQRRDLAAALTWTLTQLPEVRAVALDVRGEPYADPGIATELGRGAWTTRAPDVTSLGPSGARLPVSYALDGSDLVRVSSAGRTRIQVEVPGAEGLTGLAVRADEQGAAAIAADGSGVWLLPFDAARPAKVDLAGVQDLAADVDGHLLAVASGSVVRILAGGEVRPVPVHPAGLGPVSALSVARDGARVAALIGGQVYVGALVEGDEGLSVEALQRADAERAEASALAWHDAWTLDVLGARTEPGRAEVRRLWVGTPRSESLGWAPQARGLASAPESASLVTTAEGHVLGNVGQQWRAWGEGRSVAYPG